MSENLKEKYIVLLDKLASGLKDKNQDYKDMINSYAVLVSNNINNQDNPSEKSLDDELIWFVEEIENGIKHIRSINNGNIY